MPNPPKPPAKPGGKPGGISTKWWIVGGIGAAGIVWYSYRRANANAAAQQDAQDTSGLSSMDGGSSPASSGLGLSGIPSQGDPLSQIPAGSTVTYTAPDGSQVQVQEPSVTVPTGSTTSGGSSGGVSSTPGGTTTTTAPQVFKPYTSHDWQRQAQSYFANHHYNMATVRTAINRYQLGLSLTPTQLHIVETAVAYFGAAPGAPKVILAPTPHRPKPKPKHHGRQKATH